MIDRCIRGTLAHYSAREFRDKILSLDALLLAKCVRVQESDWWRPRLLRHPPHRPRNVSDAARQQGDALLVGLNMTPRCGGSK